MVLGATTYLHKIMTPKHTAWKTKVCLLHNILKYLEMPPRSPDLNSFKHLWNCFKRKMADRKPFNLKELKTDLQEEFWKIRCYLRQDVWNLLLRQRRGQQNIFVITVIFWMFQYCSNFVQCFLIYFLFYINYVNVLYKNCYIGN